MIYVAHVEIFQREDKVPDLYDLHSSRLAGSGPNNLHDLAHVSEVGSEQHRYVPHNISQMQVRIWMIYVMICRMFGSCVIYIMICRMFGSFMIYIMICRMFGSCTRYNNSDTKKSPS